MAEAVDPVLAHLSQIKQDCQQLVKKRAMLSAGVAVVPVPLLSLVVDAGVLTFLLPEISVKFGLEQKPEPMYDAVNKDVDWHAIKNRGIGFAKAVFKRGVVKKTFQGFGGRLAVEQIAKYIPLGGQLTSAGITYMMLKKIADEHIENCYNQALLLQKRAQQGF